MSHMKLMVHNCVPNPVDIMSDICVHTCKWGVYASDIQCMYVSQIGTKCVITNKEFWSITRQAFLPTAHTPTDETNKLHPEDDVDISLTG